MLNFDAVLRKWDNQGVVHLPPKERLTVIATLDRTGKKYSDDVISLYCATGGMSDGTPDNHMWLFWPMEQLVKENLFLSRPGLFFADFLIHSNYYIFKFESQERSSVWLDDGHELLAESVSQFFDLYLTSPGSLGMLD